MVIGLILLFFIFPIFELPIIYFLYIEKNKYARILGLILLMLIMGIAGYCFKDPKTDPDIVRYIEMAKCYSNLKFFDCFNSGPYENLFAIDLWFWLISKTGNYQLVSASACIISYGSFLYIVQDYFNKNKFSQKSKIIVTLLFFTYINFSFVVNAIRNIAAFAVFFVALYRDLYLKKRNCLTYILYIIPVFMHFSIVALIAIRFALILKKKIIVIISVLISAFPLCIEFISKVVNSLPSFIPFLGKIQQFTTRVVMYFKWNDGGWASAVSNSGYYKLNKFFSISLVVFIVIVYLLFNPIFQKEIKKRRYAFNEKFDSYIYLYIGITVACFYMVTPTYQRFTLPLWCFVCLYIGNILNYKNIKKYKKNLVLTMSCVFSFVGCFLNLYMLNTMIPIKEYFSRLISFNWIFN